MKILMLGWEYPPHIIGGLGTACEGLTTGLARQGVDLTFVVPHLFGGENAPHMQLIDSEGRGLSPDSQEQLVASAPVKGKIKKKRVPSALINPYMTPAAYQDWVKGLHVQRAAEAIARREGIALESMEALGLVDLEDSGSGGYGSDIFQEVARFASNVVNVVADQQFDIIHAHDWMTYPAGIALKAVTGKPLVTHVHSLEYDRSGQAMNEQINGIERWGVHEANLVIAVSYYTRALVNKVHNVALDKIAVVHNGVYTSRMVESYREARQFSSRIVLFLGRITFQKGPDYFVEAAAKVIPHVPDVLFVMAGAGDMLPQVQRRIRELGIEKHFYFPGFLRGPEVEQMFSLADVYVMPSVSEPFGISALEAINYDTPVIISRQSGVAEVLAHALKVDFWDVERLADLVINALVHEELRADMVSMARNEVRKLHWDAAAARTLEVYKEIH